MSKDDFKKTGLLLYLFLHYIKMSEKTTYYQRNKEVVLNREKEYYERNKQVFSEKARNKYRELSDEQKNIKRVFKK